MVFSLRQSSICTSSIAPPLRLQKVRTPELAIVEPSYYYYFRLGPYLRHVMRIPDAALFLLSTLSLAHLCLSAYPPMSGSVFILTYITTKEIHVPGSETNPHILWERISNRLSRISLALVLDFGIAVILDGIIWISWLTHGAHDANFSLPRTLFLFQLIFHRLSGR